jgi:flagellin-like protein
MKGVSPLLAGILLIAITVTVASMASGWFTSTITTSTSSTTNKTGQGLDCSGASVSIDNVFVIGTGQQLVNATVSILNNGQTDNLRIQSAQLYNVTGNNFTANNTATLSEDGVLNKGEIAILEFYNLSIAACPAAFLEVTVLTSCGGISDRFTSRPKCINS